MSTSSPYFMSRTPSAYAPSNYTTTPTYSNYGLSQTISSIPTTTSIAAVRTPSTYAPTLNGTVRYVVDEPTVTYVKPRTNNLEVRVEQLELMFQQEKQARMRADERIVALQEQLEALKAHIGELDFFQTNTLEKDLRIIEDRGNIQVNFQTGQVVLIRPITFAPRTTRDEPTAVFTKLEQATRICTDLAEVMNLFKCPCDVEGHTKGGESEFWQTLADDRARVVVEMMVKCGADPAKITAKGRPGKLGSNETKTVVHLNLPTDLLK